MVVYVGVEDRIRKEMPPVFKQAAFQALAVAAGVVSTGMPSTATPSLTLMVVAGGGFGVSQRTGQQAGHALVCVAGAVGI